MKALARLARDDSLKTEVDIKLITHCPGWAKAPRFSACGIHPKAMPPMWVETLRGEPTGEFKYNPQVTSCRDKGSKHRSKMPYIQFSIRQDRHKQEQSANQPFMPVRKTETSTGPGSWSPKDSKPLGNETSQKKEPRCRSGPPIAFGSQAPRFQSEGKGVSGGNPPPGAYDPYKPRGERRKLFQPFTLAPILNRSVPIMDDVGPATYKFESPIDQELRELKAKTRAFDAFSEPRLAPMKHGYYVVDHCHDLGPGSVDFPSMTDLLKNRHNHSKGKFMKNERFPKRPHERIFLQIPVNLRADKSNQLGPVTYDSRIPEWKTCKLKSSKAPFNLHRMARMSEKEYNEFIGNRKHLPGTLITHGPVIRVDRTGVDVIIFQSNRTPTVVLVATPHTSTRMPTIAVSRVYSKLYRASLTFKSIKFKVNAIGL